MTDLKTRPSAKDLLIEIATRAFAAHGFDGVSIGDLAQASGIAKATVMHHYRTKELVYDAVLGRVAKSLERLLERVSDLNSQGPHMLAEVAGAYLEWALAHPEESNLLAREILDNRVRADHAERWHLKKFTDHLRTLIRTEQSRGRLRRCDTALPVEMILGFAQFHVAAKATRLRLIGKADAEKYDKRVSKEWAAAIGAAFAVGELNREA